MHGTNKIVSVTVFSVRRKRRNKSNIYIYIYIYIYITCFLELQELKTNMLLIFFLGLIAKLALYCYGCDVGTTDVNNFDWNQVGSIVLIGFLKQSVIKTAACVYI